MFLSIDFRMRRILFFLALIGICRGRAPFEFVEDKHHEDIVVEYGGEVTLHCNTFDEKFDYIEWYRNDSSLAVVKKFQDKDLVTSKHYENRVKLQNKDLVIHKANFDDSAVYTCRTAVQTEEEKVSIQHGSFWKLIVKHEEL